MDAARRLPSTISVEPPPTSTTAISPSTTCPSVRVAPTNASRPSSCSREDLDREAARARDLVAHVLAVGGLAHRCRRDDADRVGIQLLGQAHLRGDRVSDLDDLVGNDRAVGSERLPQPGKGLLVHHSAQLTVIGLGDQHARGVRPDIDCRAPHPGWPSCQSRQTVSSTKKRGER